MERYLNQRLDVLHSLCEKGPHTNMENLASDLASEYAEMCKNRDLYQLSPTLPSYKLLSASQRYDNLLCRDLALSRLKRRLNMLKPLTYDLRPRCTLIHPLG